MSTYTNAKNWKDLQTNLNSYTPSTTDSGAWNTVTKYGTDTAVIKAGLFFQDLTNFRADCVLTRTCYVDTYKAFDGSAVGVSWTPASGGFVAVGTGTVSAYYGVAFNDAFTWVSAKFDSTSTTASTINHSWLNAPMSTTATTSIVISAKSVGVSGLKGWLGKPVNGNTNA
mgnify:CR=1 FL=1